VGLIVKVSENKELARFFGLILLESIEIDGLPTPAFCSNSYHRANTVTSGNVFRRRAVIPWSIKETSFHLVGWESVMALTGWM
jgi:hypothetical protein